MRKHKLLWICLSILVVRYTSILRKFRLFIHLELFVSAWECTDNAMKLFLLIINDSEYIHAASKEEIDKQFTSTFRHVSANKEYNEVFINSSESYKFDTGLLTPNHYESSH